MIESLFAIFGSFTPFILILLFLAGAGMLFKSTRSQDCVIRAQGEAINTLRQHVADSIKAQVVLHDEMTSLRERCAKLVAQQQLAKSHGPDTRRFDLAVSMLKRGTGDKQTLQELGLSNSEAKLLMRLHGAPESEVAEVTKPVPVTAQGQVLAQMLRA